jgi:CMP-N-acetylneuraminic acid synthetase
MGHNVAIVTARGGSVSIPDKNLFPIAGRPAVAYSILAAKSADRIHDVYVFTDSSRIATTATELGASTIDAPEHLCRADADRGESVCFAIDYLQERHKDLGLVTVLLGNTVMVEPELIDLSIDFLETTEGWDSVMSVWQAQDDHPYRAMAIAEGGSLISYLRTEFGFDRTIQSPRQSYPPIYFCDHGVCTLRPAVARRREGPVAWWWMGRRVKPIIRQWVTGRDFHSELDLRIAEWWVATDQVSKVVNLDDFTKR